MTKKDLNLTRMRQLLAQALAEAKTAPNARQRSLWREMANKLRDEIAIIEVTSRRKPPSGGGSDQHDGAQ